MSETTPAAGGGTTIASVVGALDSAASSQILVLDEGRLIDRGTHSELLARGGLYATLYRRQFRTQPADTIDTDEDAEAEHVLAPTGRA